MPKGYPKPQSNKIVLRPQPTLLNRPMVNFSLLNVPIYEMKIVGTSFGETLYQSSIKNLNRVGIHPTEWDAQVVFANDKNTEGPCLPSSRIVGSKVVTERRGLLKKKERLIEIVYKGPEGDNRDYTIKMELDDKHTDEFLQKIETLKQSNFDNSYWTYRSLSIPTGVGTVATVDIYPLAPFLAEGEEIIWHNMSTSGRRHKKIVWLQALTNYRVYYYNYTVYNSGIVVLLPGLQDVVVTNQRRASSSFSVGTYSMSRYNISGFRNSQTTSRMVGDIQFIAEGRPYITFRQVGDPHGLANLVKSLKRQQSHIRTGGHQVQVQSEQVQRGAKMAQIPTRIDKDEKKCSQCNHSNPHGSEFCNSCGSKLKSGCPNCGQINPDQSKFCNRCGFALA